MASAKTEDGLLPQSPLSADQGEKVNGDGDLDYTITMNESEDEASSDDASASKPVQKANGTPSSPVKVNGKMTSDEDSRSSTSKDVKAKKAGKVGEKKAEEKCGLKNQNKDDTSKGVKAQESEAEAQESETESPDKPEDLADEEKGKEEKVESKEKLDLKAPESESTLDQNKDDDCCLAEPKDPEEKKEVEESQDSQADVTDEKRNADSSKTEESESDTGNLSGQKIDDDDVVEIEDSPMKPSVGKTLEVSGASRGAKDAPFVKVSNSAVSGASFVPYLSSVPGASFLTSSSGMQLVQVQGAGLVYVPSSSSVQGSTTSATAFNQAMAGINKGHPQSTASLFMPQYTNMMSGQNRFMMPPYNQGPRSAVPSAPILSNIPDKPTSSIGMIENIRWEVENHINIKPKYAKPNPKAELGHLTKWMFDLGSDLVKEFVYHDLVRIQHSRNSEGTLSNKEKEDFIKLQEIDKELNQKIGHLKIRLNKSCKCGFRTELSNVLYNHQQHAHIERGGFFSCILCKFSTRQPSTFKFHMESMHARAGFVENRPSFFECPLCPYETNYTNRLDQHKVRCQRQFREAFNLHPSCVTGPEVNLCLENVFYYVFTRQFMNSIMPKPATPVVSSSTKIRDMPSSEVTPMNMQARRGMVSTPTSTMISSAKQIAPKAPAQTFQTGPATMKQQPQLNSALSRNFPVMSSKINMVPSQPVAPTYTSGRAQLSPQNQSSAPSQASNQPNNGFEVCEICGGYVKDRKALRIHFYYAHRIDMPFGVFERPLAPLYCATCFARFWTAQGLQKHIEVHKNDMMGTTQTSNGVAGKCISCGHRVPNILMHMRMVHNRELRHYLAALMCIFCGSRFSTKKEVEAHMGKMHGVIVKNSSVQGGIDKPQPASQSAPNSSHQQPKANTPVQKTPTDTAASKGNSKGKVNRSSQCVLCNLSFSRNVDLTRHCMRVHHTCMKCGLVVVDKESLARHTCLHSASGMRTCQICKESGFHPAYYIKHMRDKHLRKCSVVLRHIDRAVVETMKRPITISDSEEDEPAEQPTEAKRQRRNTDEKVQKVATKEKVAADHDGTKQEETDQVSVKSDSTCKKEKEKEVGKCEKEEEKRSVEEDTQCDKQDGKESKPDQAKVRDDELKDRPETDKNKEAASDDENTENQENVADEKCTDTDNAESRRTDAQDKHAKGSNEVDGHEKRDSESHAQEQNSDTVDKESVSDKQCKESSDKKNLKRKLDESDGEKDGSVRKSQRRISQIKESQD